MPLQKISILKTLIKAIILCLYLSINITKITTRQIKLKIKKHSIQIHKIYHPNKLQKVKNLFPIISIKIPTIPNQNPMYGTYLIKLSIHFSIIFKMSLKTTINLMNPISKSMMILPLKKILNFSMKMTIVYKKY
jgi:hypothetical protein